MLVEIKRIKIPKNSLNAKKTCRGLKQPHFTVVCNCIADILQNFKQNQMSVEIVIHLN